jgi:phosphate:Na+ symporter
MFDVILAVIGGLVLFLFAVNNLSDAITHAAGDNTRKWLLRFTKNTFTGIVTGIVITTILDSSSAVIIITIVLINAQLLTFRQALGIIMGANIGTTVSSQIIAMDVGRYSPVFLIAGFVLLFVAKTNTMTQTGKMILYFGMLFFGLYTMERAVEPLRDEPFFLEWMRTLDNPLKGAAIGTIVTVIIQSSSATVGMAIVLAKKGLLSMAGGIAVMIGAELGTCSDTLLATIRGSRQSIKAALFHLTFNVISVLLGLLFFTLFYQLVNAVSNGAPIERSVANAHMLFNIAGVCLFVWFIPLAEKLLNRILPDKIPSVPTIKSFDS